MKEESYAIQSRIHSVTLTLPASRHAVCTLVLSEIITQVIF